MGYTKKSNYCNLLSKDCLETCGCCVADPPSFCEKASDESAQRSVRAALAQATAVVPLEETAVWAEDWIGLRALHEREAEPEPEPLPRHKCRPVRGKKDIPGGRWNKRRCVRKSNKRKRCHGRLVKKCEKKCDGCTCNVGRQLSDAILV